MKAENTLILFNSETKELKLTEYGSDDSDIDNTTKFPENIGASYLYWREECHKGHRTAIDVIMRDFNHLCIMVKIDPQVVHTAFLQMDEYKKYFNPGQC